MWAIGSEECTGNYQFHCKNVQHGYNTKNFEDCFYVYEGNSNTDCYDLMRSGDGELLYNCAGVIDLKRSAFCNLAYQSDHLLYSDNCQGCSHCFGCFGLKESKYCILNKQYTKEEYEELVPRIIEHMKKTGEWGEFFDPAISSFGYNETKAMEWYPLTEKEVMKRGWTWSTYEQSLPDGMKGIEGNRIPENISDVPDDILNYTIRSTISGTPYRLIPQELAFYRKKGLPVPRLHPKERMQELSAVKNRHTIYTRDCPKCMKSMQTMFEPDDSQAVICEECYLQTVY